MLYAHGVATEKITAITQNFTCVEKMVALRCVARRDQLLAGNSTGENVKVVC